MNLFSGKTSKKVSDKVNERVAAAIAKQIIKAQRWLSLRLNAWFNRFSATQKKWILVSLELFTSAMLITGVIGPMYSIPQLKQPNYVSAHIGQASGLPATQLNKGQLTDSSTPKK